MKNLFMIFTFISTTILFAQEPNKIKESVWGNHEKSKKIFTVPNLKDKIVNHKTIAILPFKVSILYKKTPKNYDPQIDRDEEIRLSFELQSKMYNYLSNSKEYYSVEILNDDTTDIILNEHNMMGNAEDFTPQEIAKILGVDSVIYCTYTYSRLGSIAEAIGSELIQMAAFGFGASKVATGELTMDIYNGVDGELLWAFNKTMNQEALSSSENIVNRMMSKVERNFPYTKK